MAVQKSSIKLITMDEVMARDPDELIARVRLYSDMNKPQVALTRKLKKSLARVLTIQKRYQQLDFAHRDPSAGANKENQTLTDSSDHSNDKTSETTSLAVIPTAGWLKTGGYEAAFLAGKLSGVGTRDRQKKWKKAKDKVAAKRARQQYRRRALAQKVAT